MLIANWFTERHAGGDSGDDARRIGFHRFEQFVRHSVAPTLVSSRSYLLKLMVATNVFASAPLFDMLCHERFTANHVTGFAAIWIMGFALLVPSKLFVFWRSAKVVLALREKCAAEAHCRPKSGLPRFAAARKVRRQASRRVKSAVPSLAARRRVRCQASPPREECAVKLRRRVLRAQLSLAAA